MSNMIDVGQVQDKIKEYFNFEKVVIMGIHKDDGSYISILDQDLSDDELVYMIQTMKDNRQKHNNG